MPTSPRDLAGGTGWYQPTALLSNPRADEGHRPLRVWEVFATQPSPSYVFRGSLHIRRKRAPPHPSRATPGPPSPEGKAASGGGLPSTCYVSYRVFLQGILPQAVPQLWKGALGECFYPQKYSTALLQAVEYFSRFPRKLRDWGRGGGLYFCVICFLFVLYSSLSTVISWFSTKFIHSCGYSCG